MNIVKHMVFNIVEWDGTKDMVKILEVDSDDVLMAYSNGVEQVVTRRYLIEELKATKGDPDAWGPKVVSARFEGRGHVKVMGVFDDGHEEHLISFYSDELCFTPEEFVGKTSAQATALHMRRDVAYLRS